MTIAAGLLLIVATTLVNSSPALAEGQLDQPTNVQVTAGRRAIAATWTAPAFLADPVEHYVATALPGGKTCESPGNTTACTIQGLIASTDYTVEVVTCPTIDDFFDCSEPSNPSATVTPGPPGVPAAPAVAFTGTGGEVELTWTAPSAEGAGIAGYRVFVDPLPSNPTGTCASPTVVGTTCVIGGLTAGVSYTFRVASVGVGVTATSGASGPSASITAGAPVTPGKPTAARASDTSVTVGWAAVGGGPVSGYTVTSNPVVAPPGGCLNVNALSCVFTGLDEDTTYTFRVRANGAGAGPGSGNSTLSVASDPVTPGAPGVPGTPTATVSTVGQATVTWTASATNSPTDGSPVTGYSVTSDPAVAPPGGCTNTLLLTCTFTGLDPATSYTFIVTAIGASDSTPSALTSNAVVPGAPGAPGTPTVTSTAPGAATLTWTEPSSGAQVLGYSVTSSPVVAPPAACTDVLVLTCQFTGLNVDTSYTFTVTALGVVDDTASSASATLVPGPPGVPGNPTVESTTPGTVTVSWTEPPNGGSVNGYTVTSNPSVATPADCSMVDALTCEFTGLNPTTSYTFRVTASGGAGITQSAGSSAAVVPGAPNTPGTPTVASTTPGTVTVSWTAPVGGADVTGYSVTSQPDVAPPGGCTDVLTLTCEFTGLNPTISYRFTVTAIGSADERESALSAAIVPDDPGVPGTPTVVSTVPGTATVSWTAPTSGGAITGYTVTNDQGATTPAGCTMVNALTCQFTGLNPATSYTFLVTAVGPAGDTDSAGSSTAMVPGLPGIPGTPTVASTVPGTATVTWTAPMGGGSITGYTVTSNPSVSTPAGCTVVDALSCQFTGLNPNTSYTFTVTAVGPTGVRASAGASTALIPGAPSAPGTPTLQVMASGTVRLTWTAPTQGGAVTGYSVTSSPGVAAPGACTGTLLLTCDFTGLNPNTAYTFTVTAAGSAGGTPSAQSASVVAGPPGAPGTPAVSITGPNTIRVTWTAPSGGGPVTNYSVTSDPVVAPPAGCTNTAALTCDFTGVSLGVAYTFRVTAQGAGGTTASASSASVSAALPGVPGTATAQAISAGTVRVTWTAPTGGGPVSSYTITSEPAVTPPAACTSVAALTCDFNGLQDDQTYTFLVTANGPVGTTSSAASSTPVTTAPAGVPGTPSVVRQGANAVRVTWTAPVTGGPVLGYSVTSQPGVVAPAGCTNVVALTCRFDNLISGVTYTFRVAARGAAGEPAVSEASAGIVAGPPDAPAKPTVMLTAVQKQVRVSWTAPSAGAGIDGYIVQSTPGNRGCDDPADAAATSCLVSDLELETSYTFRVQAVGVPNSGNSVFSPASNPVVAGGVNAPTDVDVFGADRQVSVSWTASADAGGLIASYRATATPGDATCTTESSFATDCVITGLSNLTSYRVTVMAIGVEGTENSAPSAPSVRVRPTAGLPGAPTGVQAVARDQGAFVNWTAPASVGDGIARYTATATPGGRACVTSNAGTNCTITGLTNNLDYTITVVAVGRSASGASGPSTPPVTVRPRPGPAAPTGVIVTAGIATLAVRFTPSIGGGVVNYTATAAGGPSSGPCVTTNPSTTPCVIKGVTPGASYTVSVVANGTTPGLNSAPSAESSSVTALAFPAPKLPLSTPTGTAVTGTLTSSGGTTLPLGSVTTISGDGFAPFSGVTVGIYSGAASLATAVTDAEGAFTVQVTVTGVTAGARTIVAAAMRPTGTVRYKSLPVTVSAALTGNSGAITARTAAIASTPVTVAIPAARRTTVAAL